VGYASSLHGLDEAAYGRMSLEDPVLQLAYQTVFGSSISGGFYGLPPAVSAALADLRKRGDTVTPMLLQLMERNHETGFESSVLASIAAVGTINVEPYLEYARRLLRERTDTMNGALVGCAAQLLASHGTKEDGDLMIWVMETRPYVADAVTRKLDALNRRLGLPKQVPRPNLKDSAPTSAPSEANSRRDLRRPSVPSEEKSAPISPWFKRALIVVILAGLLWFVIKSRKATNS